ncbi:MAG: response regulator [Deltaproteobacteria bacterium]|nr:response regulator [Deltaproteobacteria bacterium]
MTILIVEDNPVNAEMLRLALEKDRYAVVHAGDGAEALATLEEHPEIDLVVTDVLMPNLGGLEMIERVRQRPEWRTLPVVVATSVANHATVRQASSLHCKHFIVKPFTVQLLLQTVREAIGQRGVVLQEKARVVGRLGLEPEGYDQLALAFASFVHERVAALTSLSERTEHEEVDPAQRRDLFALEESAALLGAERLGNLLAALGWPNGTVPHDALGGAYKALLAELRLVSAALPPPRRAGGDPLAADTPRDADAAPAEPGA